MSGRDVVLGKVRRALGASEGDAARRRAVEERLARHSANIIPARGQLDPEGRVALFCRMAEKVSATVRAARRPGRDPGRRRRASARVIICRSRCAPAPIRCSRRCRGSASRIWSGGSARPTATTPCRSAAPSRAWRRRERSSSSRAPDNPTTLNFLPDTHIVVVQEADIAGDYETVWQRLRELYGPGALPRTVNFITGPSRSADIEQTLILGAHGPRALHILVVRVGFRLACA